MLLRFYVRTVSEIYLVYTDILWIFTRCRAQNVPESVNFGLKDAAPLHWPRIDKRNKVGVLYFCIRESKGYNIM